MSAILWQPFPQRQETMSLHEASFSFFFLVECLLFYRLLFLYFLFNKIELIGVEKIEFLRVCKLNCAGQNQVALLVTGIASKKPIYYYSLN